MTDALFSINGDSNDQGFDAVANQTLTLRLKTLPVSGVSSVLFQVFSPSAFDDALGIARNPPRASSGAPLLTLNNGSATGQSISPLAVDGTVQVVMPNTGAYSWIVRCVVNGGMGALADGRVGARADLIHERMIVIRDGLANRRIVATETTQYDDDGWAGAINEALENIANVLV